MLNTRMFEDANAVKLRHPNFDIQTYIHIVSVEDVGHILAVFPTVHFSKSAINIHEKT